MAAPTATPTPTAAPGPTPTAAASGSKVDVVEGDSISVFWGGSSTGIFAAQHAAVKFCGTAVGGAQISSSGGNGLVQRQADDLALKPTWLSVFIGANDLGEAKYPTVQAWLNDLFAYTATVRAAGAKVAVGTVLPVCFPTNSQYTTTFNARRQVANQAIRAAVGSKIDAVIDFAADPDIGPDAAACDLTSFKDGLHPTDGNSRFQGGEGRMAKIYTTAMEPLVQ